MSCTRRLAGPRSHRRSYCVRCCYRFCTQCEALYTARSERLLMEQLQYNLLFRWFVGLNMDEPVWVATVFSKNREMRGMRVTPHVAQNDQRRGGSAIDGRTTRQPGGHARLVRILASITGLASR